MYVGVDGQYFNCESPSYGEPCTVGELGIRGLDGNRVLMPKLLRKGNSLPGAS